jgi:hypothetical protein
MQKVLLQNSNDENYESPVTNNISRDAHLLHQKLLKRDGEVVNLQELFSESPKASYGVLKELHEHGLLAFPKISEHGNGHSLRKIAVKDSKVVIVGMWNKKQTGI